MVYPRHRERRRELLMIVREWISRSNDVTNVEILTISLSPPRPPRSPRSPSPIPSSQVCYYDSSKDGKCHGTIAIRDIEKVEEAEPQVVPTLKQGEAGFFFTVSSIVIMCVVTVQRIKKMKMKSD